MSVQLDRRAEELRLRVVRRALRHDSAPKHVAGTASFIDDIREPEGLLHIAVGGAPIAAGQLLGVDLDAVRAAPGVVAVLTAADIPGKNDVSPVAARRSGVRRQQDRVLTARWCSPWWRRRASRRARRRGSPRSRPRSARRSVSVDDALAAETRILPDYTFRKDDSAAALREQPEPREGPAAHRRAGALLSRRPGVARHPGRGRRHAGPLLDPASERDAST